MCWSQRAYASAPPSSVGAPSGVALSPSGRGGGSVLFINAHLLAACSVRRRDRPSEELGHIRRCGSSGGLSYFCSQPPIFGSRPRGGNRVDNGCPATSCAVAARMLSTARSEEHT